MVYLISFGLAVGLAVLSLSAWRKKWIIDDTPTSDCRGVFVGRNEVIGVAAPLYEPITTPFSQSQAVWWSWHLERYQSSGENSSWVTVERRETAAPFWIQDQTGRVLVRPRQADVHGRQTLCERLDRGFAPPYSRWQLRQWVLVGEDVVERQRSLQDGDFHEPPESGGFLSFTADTAGPISALSGKHRITEKVIEVGAPLYLLGTARPRTDAPGLEFTGEAGDLLVSVKSEEQVASSSGWTARLAGLGSLACSAWFVGLVTDSLRGEIWWAGVIGVVVAELLGLFVIALMRNYNRQVEVKEQAAKAWSLIDVSLQRRADLLPHLAAVVEAAREHERQIQVAVAELRSVPAKPPTEVLPTDATLAQAETSDRGLRAAARTTGALAEAYPDLQANDVFLDLQRRMADAEDAVASAREFYNDAIEMLRTRRTQFPGSLFARYVDVPSWRLFEAEEAATYVPSVATAPEAAPPPDPGGGPAGPGATTPPGPPVPPAPPSGGSSF